MAAAVQQRDEQRAAHVEALRAALATLMRDAARAVAQAPLELILQTAAKAGQHGRAAGQHDVLGELDLQVLVAQLQGRRDERRHARGDRRAKARE